MPQDIVIELDDEFFARFEAFAKANGLTAEGLARVALTKSAEEYLKEHPDE